LLVSPPVIGRVAEPFVCVTSAPPYPPPIQRWRPSVLPRGTAYAISRKSGNAVTRNRIRRRLRAALFALDRDQPDAFVAGDYLFTAGSELSTVPFEDVQQMVRRAVCSVASAVHGSSSPGR
jgi:Ribonuclease P